MLVTKKKFDKLKDDLSTIMSDLILSDIKKMARIENRLIDLEKKVSALCDHLNLAVEKPDKYFDKTKDQENNHRPKFGKSLL